jgi:hypothetical protein
VNAVTEIYVLHVRVSSASLFEFQLVLVGEFVEVAYDQSGIRTVVNEKAWCSDPTLEVI